VVILLHHAVIYTQAHGSPRVTDVRQPSRLPGPRRFALPDSPVPPDPGSRGPRGRRGASAVSAAAADQGARGTRGLDRRRVGRAPPDPTPPRRQAGEPLGERRHGRAAAGGTRPP